MTTSISPENSDKPKFPTFAKLFRIGIFILACVVTLVGLFHAEENIRGRNAWNKFRQELEAKGEPTSYALLIPPRVPDDQNFATTPRLAALFVYKPMTQELLDTNAYANARLGDFVNLPNLTWTNRAETDFAACLKAMIKTRSQRLPTSLRGGLASDEYVAKYSIPSDRVAAAAQLLNEFTNCSAATREIEEAVRRPYSRFNVRYEQENKAAILLPHLAVIKQYCIAFSTRAAAELAVGQTDQAFKDVDTALRIMDSVKDEPILISHLVRCAAYRICLQPVWEGLAHHQWSDSQVETFQKRFQQIDFLDRQAYVLKAERCFGDSCFDFWLAHPSEGMQSFEVIKSEGQNFDNPGLPDWVLRVVIPRGWIALERVNYHRLFMQDINSCADRTNGLIRPEVVAEKSRDLAAELGGTFGHRLFSHRVGAQVLLPALFNVEIRTAQAQTAVNLATTACALERCRLANGQLPEKLEALVPKFISKMPLDIVNGQPLVYRCSEGGRFVLYSVGWDLKDDGGDLDVVRNTGLAPATQGPIFGISGLQKDWGWQSPK